MCVCPGFDAHVLMANGDAKQPEPDSSVSAASARKNVGKQTGRAEDRARRGKNAFGGKLLRKK